MEPGHNGGPAPAAVRWIARAEVALVGTILLVSLLITLYAIIARNLGYSTGDWALKLPEIMLVWMTFIGMGALVTEHGHVAADMFLMRFPPRWKRIAQIASAVISAAVLGLIVVGAVSIVLQQIDIGATDEELFDIPTAYILSVQPLGLTIAIMHLLVELYAIWRPAKADAP
jgi:TRAP-type C4-dicarboxylate transport system permease small subunit